MSKIVCDICKVRPATTEVTVVENGRERQLRVCDVDLRKLQRQSASPFERMLRARFFGSRDESEDFGDFFSRSGYPLPRHREAIDVDQFLSTHAKELIQEAAQTALKFNRREVDTEHLLYAISNSEVIKEIYKQFKIRPEEIYGYLDTNAPKGTVQPKEGETIQLSISPRVKNVIETAFQTAQELGHNYIGPEHLLVG
jgi:ATP-dependent Clp protease ATP-binding subunit ClpC